jgi:hypothetical protein
MEINKFTDIIGVLATSAIKEGRMVCLTPASVLDTNYNYGSRSDLMGIKLPSTAAEAAKSKYVSAFALDNRPTPIIEGLPQYAWSMRSGGWDQVGNLPASGLTLFMDHPGNMTVVQTIPSGSLALAFDKGVFTVTSGNFIYNAGLVSGAPLSVSYAGGTEGELQYDANGTIGVVEHFDSANFTLTFRTL